MDLLDELLPVIGSVIGSFVVFGLLVWSMTTIRYVIEGRRLRIKWLGAPIRDIALEDIKSIGHRPVFWAERWLNTLKVGNGRLVLRVRRGLFKTIIISPRNYMVFKAELERARKLATAGATLEPENQDTVFSEVEPSG